MVQTDGGRPAVSSSLRVGAVLLVLVVGAGALASRTAPDLVTPASFWPSAAVQVLAFGLVFHRLGRQLWTLAWLAVAAAVVVGDLLGGRALGRSIGHAVLEVVGTMLAGLVLTGVGRRTPRLDQVPDVARLILAGAVSGAAVAVVGTIALAHDGLHPGLITTGTVLSTHLAAVLLLVPLSLPLGTHRSGRRVELAVQVLLLTAACALTFDTDRTASVLTFAPVLFLVWAAMRFEARVVVGELLLLAVLVTVQDQLGAGPFVGLVEAHRASSLAAGALTQLYLAAIALLVLPLAVSVQHNAVLVARVTADARRFRRNFTQSLVGMAFLEPEQGGADLLVTDINETALAILGAAEHDLIGRGLRTVIGCGTEYDQLLPELLAGSREGWRSQCWLVGPRAGRVDVQLSLLSTPGDQALWAVQLIDVTGEHQARRDLEAAQRLVGHLMDASLNTALVGVDAAGRITVVNSGVAHLLGYDRAELVGQPFHRLLNNSELLERTGADSLTSAFETLVRGLGVEGESRPRDWSWVTRAGADRLVSMSLSAVPDPATAPGGYLCVARDVTETRQSQQMLMAALDKERTAVERLRAVDQAKNQFVSTVSHELRTPVTSIVGYVEMMLDGTPVEPASEQLPLLATIGRNGERLIAMIDDLLLLGGLDAGSVQTRREVVDLAQLLGPVAESVRALTVGRDLRLDVPVPSRLIAVAGDAIQLERVVVNLVSNAVKFTDDGGAIMVSLDAEADQAVLRVTDTGIGIPAAEQGDLFHRFFRSSTAQSRQIQGTGLGLSIVAEIVAAHRGTVSVTSAHLAGSTFTVRLPLAPTVPAGADSKPPEDRVASAVGAGLRLPIG